MPDQPKVETVHVGLLIDESGSMGGNQPAVIGGINEFIGSLHAQEDDSAVRVSLGMFDLHGNDPALRMKFKGIPLEEVTPLGPGDYRPRGSTPLNDAVVKMIRRLKKQVKEDDRAIVVILTDGLENASRTPTDEVRKAIHKREKAGWEFIYLGANQDSWAQARRLGLAKSQGRAFDWDATPEGTAAAVQLSAQRVQSFRSDADTYIAEADELGRRG